VQGARGGDAGTDHDAREVTDDGGAGSGDHAARQLSALYGDAHAHLHALQVAVDLGVAGADDAAPHVPAHEHERRTEHVTEQILPNT
jgi:hypothetical protein